MTIPDLLKAERQARHRVVRRAALHWTLVVVGLGLYATFWYQLIFRLLNHIDP